MLIIGGEFCKNPPKVLFVEHDQMIGTFAPDRSGSLLAKAGIHFQKGESVELVDTRTSKVDRHKKKGPEEIPGLHHFG
jgi:hypothetical protein